jgi:RNA polymerase sigma factor (sigma-70 family)
MGTIARTDVELVEASRRGEHEAFGPLVARYQDVICAVSYSSTRDSGLIEDVAQETFIAAWSQLDRLRDTARLRPWLCGIARNLARNARKRRRREEVIDADDHVATDASPFEATARGEAERVVRQALARIPDVYREVLVLYYRDHQSIREVAATLGTTEASAMQRLSRARRYLADGVHELVKRSLQDRRPRRDLVAAVLAAIAVITVAPRVDASPTKGSTMLKPQRADARERQRPPAARGSRNVHMAPPEGSGSKWCRGLAPHSMAVRRSVSGIGNACFGDLGRASVLMDPDHRPSLTSLTPMWPSRRAWWLTELPSSRW